MADIGIDLGTTNSVLAFLRGGPEVINIKGRPLLPSVVAYDGDGFLVGTAAKNLAATSDDVIVSPKRMMGTDHKYSIAGRSYTPINVSAMILKEIKKQAEDFLGEPVTSAVITIPAYFNQKQVDDTRKAGEEAGLKVGKLLAEPVAASATYGSGGEETILVFDLGGGTLDCTVVDTFDAKILGLSGDNWLGGDDFDNRVVDRMIKHLMDEQGLDVSGDKKARLRLKAIAELNKINLSEANSTQVEFVGKLGGKLCQIDFRLTRAEYNRMIEDLVNRALEKADEAIKRADLRREDIDVVLLVGGSTLTPYVQERLADHFGRAPSKRADPMLSVGLGAAICTRDLGWDGKTHRVMLRSRAEVWPEGTYTVRGRTTANSRIEILGGAEPADTAAGGEGQFSVEVKLMPNSVNDLTIQAKSPAGESAKAMQRIRHDPSAVSETGKAVEPPPSPVIAPTLPRNYMVGMEDHQVAVIVPHATTLPASGETDQFFCKANPAPFTLQVPVYEGSFPDHEIPYGPFNTLMGTLYVQCPPTSGITQLVLAFELDENRAIIVKCWFKDDPSVSNQIKLQPQNIARDNMHLVERVEITVNSAGERILPDEKARINRKKQALVDLCEQYARGQSPDVRGKIIETGNELKSEIKAIEQKYNL